MDLTDFTIKAIWESGVMEKAMESALDSLLKNSF
jgi:hypothetical protein